VDDTYSLYRYAARCLLPASLAAAAKRARAAPACAGPPFRSGDWRPGADGFLEAEEDGCVIRVRLAGGAGRHSLCTLSRESLTLLLLLPEDATPDAALRAQLAAVAGACPAAVPQSQRALRPHRTALPRQSCA
jgi:hypothetical protein